MEATSWKNTASPYGSDKKVSSMSLFTFLTKTALHLLTFNHKSPNNRLVTWHKVLTGHSSKIQQRNLHLRAQNSSLFHGSKAGKISSKKTVCQMNCPPTKLFIFHSNATCMWRLMCYKIYWIEIKNFVAKNSWRN